MIPSVVKPRPVIKRGWLRVLIFLPAWIVSELSILMIAGLIVVFYVKLFKNPHTAMISIEEALLYLEATDPVGLFFSQLIAILGTLLAVTLFRKLVDGEDLWSLGFAFTGFKVHFLLGCLAGIVAISIVFGLLLGSGQLEYLGRNPSFDAAGVILALVTYFIVAINEEIVLRGYVLSNLTKSINGYVAVALSSVLFAALHLWNANLSAIGILNIGLAGITFGVYYHHFRNLWFPIGLHFTWNLVQGPVFGFNVSGTATDGILLQGAVGPRWLTGGGFGLEGSVVTTVALVFLITTIHLWGLKKRPDYSTETSSV